MGDLSWVWGNWRSLWPWHFMNLVFAIASVVCGLVVGSERQRREKAAGLRTLTMVSLGSAVFTMASFAFETTTGDSGRVAAQIVTGIGFLGAGVILHGQRRISGMTTAALIWVTAAIGMTVGAGYVVPGLVLSFFVNRLLVGIFIYETRWHPELHHSCVVIDYGLNGGITRLRLERILADYNLQESREEWTDASPSVGRLRLNVRLPRMLLYDLLNELADVPDVRSIEQESLVALRKKIPDEKNKNKP